MGIASKKTGAFFKLNVEKDVWELTDILLRRTVLISRKDLFSGIAELSEFLVFELTGEEEVDILGWASQSIKQEVEDRFISAGFSWQDMEQWAKNCYAMDINPLVPIRKLLAESLIPVHYCATLDDALPSFFATGLTCVRYMHLEDKPVAFVATGTLEDLEREASNLQRMLRIAGIRP